MDPLQIELEQLDKERSTLLAKTETTDFTADDATRAEEVVKRIGEIKELTAKRAKATASLRAAGIGNPVQKQEVDEDDAPATGGLGDRFVKSKAYKDFRAANSAPVDGRPVAFKAAALGPLLASKAAGDPAPLSSAAGGAIVYEREAGIVDLTYAKRPKLLDFITTGTTASSYLEYRQLIAVTAGAAVVREGQTKPLTTLTTSSAQAIAHVVADGIKVTNQELADDGVIATLLNSTLTKNVYKKLEDLVLNGTGVNEPKGILNTTGVLAEAFSGDILETIRKAITTLEETSETEDVYVILHPRDAELLDLIKDDSGRYLGPGPFAKAVETVWARPRATSSKIPRGKALMGDLSAVHLLEREGLSVEAFNQNEDDARNNLTYLRAETRQLLLIREPARLLVATITGP